MVLSKFERMIERISKKVTEIEMETSTYSIINRARYYDNYIIAFRREANKTLKNNKNIVDFIDTVEYRMFEGLFTEIVAILDALQEIKNHPFHYPLENYTQNERLKLCERASALKEGLEDHDGFVESTFEYGGNYTGMLNTFLRLRKNIRDEVKDVYEYFKL